MSKAKRKADRPEAAYLYNLEQSKEDNVFIGRVAEFPSLAAHGDTPESALKEIMFVVRAVLDDLRAAGEEIPEPLSRRPFSGKFNVRIPPALHRRLSIEAASEGVSLNNLVTAKLGALSHHRAERNNGKGS